MSSSSKQAGTPEGRLVCGTAESAGWRSPRRILALAQTPRLAEQLEQMLQGAGVVTQLADVERTRLLLRAQRWDALVLDLDTAGIDGLAFCRDLRHGCKELPIVMVGGNCTEAERVRGLDMGADDHLAKPLGLRELLARLRAIWRRIDAMRSPAPGVRREPVEVGASGLVLNRVERRAWLAGVELRLTRREFDLLWHFVCHPGRTFSREQLLRAVWGSGHDGYEHTVNSHVNRLRGKLGGSWITTVWAVGYRFGQAASAQSAAPAEASS